MKMSCQESACNTMIKPHGPSLLCFTGALGVLRGFGLQTLQFERADPLNTNMVSPVVMTMLHPFS